VGILFPMLLFSAVCTGLIFVGMRDLKSVRRRKSIGRIARKSEELGDYDKFVE
jgi:hypothetical protein